VETGWRWPQQSRNPTPHARVCHVTPAIDTAAAQPQPVLPRPRALRRALPAVALVLLVVAVYAPTLRAYFLHDDWWHLDLTWHFAHKGLASIWTAPHEGFYRPLFSSLFGLCTVLFGLNAVAWHVCAIAIHVTNVLLVRWLFRRMAVSDPAATLGAALFALHPLHPESVALLCSALEGPVAALGALCAAHVAITVAMRPLSRAGLCAVLMALALCAKEEVIGMFAVVPLLPIVLGRLPGRRGVIAWIGGCLLMALALAAFLHMEHQGTTLYGTEMPHLNLQTLRQAFLQPLRPILPELRVHWFWLILPALALVAWRGCPALQAGAIWLFATGMPLGAVLGSPAAAPRYAYLPSIGLALCLAVALERLLRAERGISPPVWWVLAAPILIAYTRIGWESPYWCIVIIGLCGFVSCRHAGGIAPARGLAVIATLMLAYRGLLAFMPSVEMPADADLAASVVAFGAWWSLASRLGGERSPSNAVVMLICSFAMFWPSDPRVWAVYAAVPAGVAVWWIIETAFVWRGENDHGAVPCSPSSPHGEGAGGEAPSRGSAGQGRLCWRPEALALAGVVILCAAVSTARTNLRWMRTGAGIQRAVERLAPLMQALPSGAYVVITNPPFPQMYVAGALVRFDVVARLIAGRDDLVVDTLDKDGWYSRPYFRWAPGEAPDAYRGQAEYRRSARLQYTVTWEGDGRPVLTAGPAWP